MIGVWLALLQGVAGATGEGDDLLALTRTERSFDGASEIAEARARVRALLQALQLPDDRRVAFEATPLRDVVFEARSAKVGWAANALVLVDEDAELSFADGNVIIAVGSVKISHSSRNVVIAGGKIDVGHDGSAGNGSLLVSQTSVQVSHAWGTIIYAPGGLTIGHARNVVALNTPARKVSHGHVNNIGIESVWQSSQDPAVVAPVPSASPRSSPATPPSPSGLPPPSPSPSPSALSPGLRSFSPPPSASAPPSPEPSPSVSPSSSLEPRPSASPAPESKSSPDPDWLLAVMSVLVGAATAFVGLVLAKKLIRNVPQRSVGVSVSDVVVDAPRSERDLDTRVGLGSGGSNGA